MRIGGTGMKLSESRPYSIDVQKAFSGREARKRGSGGRGNKAGSEVGIKVGAPEEPKWKKFLDGKKTVTNWEEERLGKGPGN